MSNATDNQINILKKYRKYTINRTIKKLSKLWLKYPYMRLGQLISEVCLADTDNTIYYESDEVLEHCIDDAIKEGIR